MDTCVCCGFPVPEGRQVCPVCEGKAEPDLITKDGGSGVFRKMVAWGDPPYKIGYMKNYKELS